MLSCMSVSSLCSTYNFSDNVLLASSLWCLIFDFHYIVYQFLLILNVKDKCLWCVSPLRCFFLACLSFGLLTKKPFWCFEIFNFILGALTWCLRHPNPTLDYLGSIPGPGCWLQHAAVVDPGRQQWRLRQLGFCHLWERLGRIPGSWKFGGIGQWIGAALFSPSVSLFLFLSFSESLCLSDKQISLGIHSAQYLDLFVISIRALEAWEHYDFFEWRQIRESHSISPPTQL